MRTEFEKDIMAPTLEGLIKEKFDYRGFIFFGVMLTKNGPKLLEYNVRLGDPETQAVLPLMDFDFVDMQINTALYNPQQIVEQILEKLVSMGLVEKSEN
mgnify:CR=1 FL=1